MLHSLTSLTLITLIAGPGPAWAQTMDAGPGPLYFSLEGGPGMSTNIFGGTNTAGGFSNTDSILSQEGFVGLSFGRKNGLKIAGKAFTVEVEVNRSADFSTTSASFPGLPAPTFLYTSAITINRLGGNLWYDVGQIAGIEFEVGAGLGLQVTNFSSSDGVVNTATQSVFNSPYGTIGLRASKALSAKTLLTFSTKYYGSAPISAPLTSVGGGAPSGNLTHATSGFRAGLGLQYFFKK